MTSIYEIRNIVNNKVYIGSTNSIERRWKTHKKRLKRGIHVNNYLQRSFNKYGGDNFTYKVIEEEVPTHMQYIREQFWQDHNKSYEASFGYNLGRTSHVKGGPCKVYHTYNISTKEFSTEIGYGGLVNNKKMSERNVGACIGKESMAVHRGHLVATSFEILQQKIIKYLERSLNNQKYYTYNNKGNYEGEKLSCAKINENRMYRGLYYKTKYLGESIKPPTKRKSTSRGCKVYLYNKDGQFLKVFNTIKDCAKFTGGHLRRIKERSLGYSLTNSGIKRPTRLYKGYYFFREFHEDISKYLE